MTGIQKAFLFVLSASAAAGGTYVVFGAGRRAAGATAGGELAESRRLDVMKGSGQVGFFSSAASASSGPGGGLNPAVMADLRLEGIDLAAIDEFRAMLRDAVTPGDAMEKMRRLLALRDRLARANAAGPQPWSSGIGASLAVAGRAGRDAVSSVVDSVAGMWDRLIHELDL